MLIEDTITLKFTFGFFIQFDTNFFKHLNPLLITTAPVFGDGKRDGII